MSKILVRTMFCVECNLLPDWVHVSAKNYSSRVPTSSYVPAALELSLLEREVGDLWPCIRNPLIEGFTTRENSKLSVKAFVAITSQGRRKVKNWWGQN